MTTTSPPPSSTEFEFDGDLETTEWVVIVILLVIILIALIIAVAKCLELPPAEKAMVKQEAESARSSFRASPYTSPSNTMASSKGRSFNRMPLNAEITRLSAGRVSRSAQYGVVIKDIAKTLPASEPAPQPGVASDMLPPSTMSPPPGYDEAPMHSSMPYHAQPHQTLRSEPIPPPILAPPNSRAVFQAPEQDFQPKAPRLTVGTSRAIVLDPQYLSQGQLRY